MIILSMLNIGLLLFLLKVDRRRFSRDIFSPGSLFIYFAALPALSNLYFSIFADKFNEIVLIQVAPMYRDGLYVNLALLMAILGNVVTYVGILNGAFSKDKTFSRILDRLFLLRVFEQLGGSERKKEQVIFLFGFVTFVLGLFVYAVFLEKIGGLFNLWAELQSRSVKNAGLGYLQTFFMVAIQVGVILMLSVTFQRSKKLYSTILILLGVFVMGSMGARGPVVILLFSCFLLYHFKVKKFNRLANPKLLLMALIIPIFIVVMLQFRSDSYENLTQDLDLLVSKSISNFEEGFVARTGRLERDIVILKYFYDNGFWWGKSYLGLLYAPIPRSMIPEKPPNDTGMYLRMMALGYTVDPPQPITELSSSSWPEGNWAGYMNWGLPGYVFFFFMSGFLYGRFYRYLVKYKFPVLGTCLFAVVAVPGPPLFSPAALITLIMLFLIVWILVVLLLPPLRMLLRVPKKRVLIASLATLFNHVPPR
jgi:hypothetical protein